MQAPTIHVASMTRWWVDTNLNRPCFCDSRISDSSPLSIKYNHMPEPGSGSAISAIDSPVIFHRPLRILTSRNEIPVIAYSDDSLWLKCIPSKLDLLNEFPCRRASQDDKLATDILKLGGGSRGRQRAWGESNSRLGDCDVAGLYSGV